MSGRVWLSPLGNVAAALGREGTGGPAIPAELVAAVEGMQLDPGIVTRAWELVRCGVGADEADQRALLWLVSAALVAVERGSTRMPLRNEVLAKLLSEVGAPDGDVRSVQALIERARAGEDFLLFGRPGEYRPLLFDSDHLYLHRLHFHESKLVEALRSRLEAEARAFAPDALASALASILDAPPRRSGVDIRLSAEQQRAALAAIHLPLTVISGGPGTGKTSIVASILRLLLRLGVEAESIALAAPTGKAANRMHESLQSYLGSIVAPSPEDARLVEAGPEPRTLHRLLGYLPSNDTFGHHEGNPLPQRVVIVDEASMIHLFLMRRLLRALHPDANLVLLGDAEQLPSVEAGAVLRDLLPQGPRLVRPWDELVSPEEGEDPPVKHAPLRARAAVRLTRSYRMDPSDPAGRNILSVARSLNRGDAESILARPEEEGIASRPDVAALRFSRTELLVGGGEARGAFLERWFEQRICGMPGFRSAIRREYRWDGSDFAEEDRQAVAALLAHYDSFRILCCTRGAQLPTGADAVNAALHELALGRFRGEEGREPTFLPGEPVMMQRNDYARGLFNGDQGVILRVREKGGVGHHFRAVFPRREGYGVFHLEGLRNWLTRSWAMTVHKAQGSEFDTVALLLPDQPIPLLTREILYTAVTRSRRSVVIVGRPEVLRAGAAQRAERWSGVAERLEA